MKPFEYLAPDSLSDAIALLQERGEGGRPLAGGTDLVVQVTEGIKVSPPSYLVSLRRVPELRGIEFSETTGLRLGALTTMAEIAESTLIRERYSALADGAGIVGSIQTMNMATVGGNVCNAAPSADTAPPLLVHEAVAVIAGPEGEREVPLEKFWLGPGQTVLQRGELLRELRLPPPPPGNRSKYARHTPRKQMDIAVVGVAVSLAIAGAGRVERARIALGAVAPTAIRARKAEAVMEGQTPTDELFAKAAEAAASEASPIDDIRGSAQFRSHMVQVMAGRLLEQAAAIGV